MITFSNDKLYVGRQNTHIYLVSGPSAAFAFCVMSLINKTNVSILTFQRVISHLSGFFFFPAHAAWILGRLRMALFQIHFLLMLSLTALASNSTTRGEGTTARDY